MPKVSGSSLPLSGLFGVAKPSGPTSMSIVNDIKLLACKSRLFVDPSKLKDLPSKSIREGRKGFKIGQGGTLDPLADGVLVVGVGKGTKKLSDFLDCVKEYRTTCLLGCSTDSYDSEGARLRVAPWHHVTQELVESKLGLFRGKILQTPPIFSALKMDGRPLYEYARKGIPLPRPIEKREATVHSLELIQWKGSDHSFRWPEKQLSGEEIRALKKALESVEKDDIFQGEVEDVVHAKPPTAFVLSMKVSGGTYVRSIVHDLSSAIGSAGHVVTLTRVRQGRFALEPTEQEVGCVPWEVFRRAMEDSGEVDDEGWAEWERTVMSRFEVIDEK